MPRFQEDLDCDRVQDLIDNLEQSIIKVYRWAYANCEGPIGDCPVWVFHRIWQMYKDISEIQEIVREWEE